jgi:lipoprotein-anchoring transpeptidase ErfK/SrfK
VEQRVGADRVAYGAVVLRSVATYRWPGGARLATLSVSDGCIRLANAVVARLFALTPAGTPVIIQA